ncbi:MAG TPA: TCR/Tet family MFS transporter [Flavipsychrobacter sp.]|nr:TCR/Tet family MFS transporter [Flavipsychrobacter sp.]
MTVKRNAAVGFIFVTLLIDCIGLGIIIPVMPKLIQQLTGSNLSVASEYGGWLTAVYAIMQFVCAPILGNLSDRYGRRPVLLLSLFGLGVDYLFLSFAPTIGLLFVGRIIAGIFGASFTTGTAYLADISTPEKRAQNFGLVGAAFGLGFIIGPAIGGKFGELGLRVPFMVAAALSLLNCIYGLFILPESLLKENRRRFEWKRANPVGSLLHLKKYPIISGLIVSLILMYVAGYSVQATWTFYTMLKFNWSTGLVGYSLGFVGILIAIVQGGLIRYTIPKFGQKNSIYIGLILYMTGCALFGFATQSWMMFVFLIPYCLGGIAGPALQGIISSQVPANEQGELQGALTSLMNVTSIVGPLIMTGLFSYFTRPKAPVYFPGAPYLMGAILMLLSIIFSVGSLKAHHLATLKEKENAMEQVEV